MLNRNTRDRRNTLSALGALGLTMSVCLGLATPAHANEEATSSTSLPTVSGELGTATIGSFYEYQFTMTGDGTHLRAADLPPGMNIDSFTGKFSGTPANRSGAYTFSLIARNADGFERKDFTLLVVASHTEVDESWMIPKGGTIRPEDMRCPATHPYLINRDYKPEHQLLGNLVPLGVEVFSGWSGSAGAIVENGYLVGAKDIHFDNPGGVPNPARMVLHCTNDLNEAAHVIPGLG